MKSTYLSTVALVFIATGLFAQTAVNEQLGEARKYYNNGELQESRNALQQSLAELDVIICKEIMAALPTEIKGMPYNKEADFVAGNALALTGTTVQRSYEQGEKTMEINMVNNSPLMSMLTAFLTNPLFANTADGSQKQVKIAGIKSVLQKNAEYEDVWTLQIPLNESLMTVEYNKFTEQEALEAAEQLNLSKIVDILN